MCTWVWARVCMCTLVCVQSVGERVHVGMGTGMCARSCACNLWMNECAHVGTGTCVRVCLLYASLQAPSPEQPCPLGLGVPSGVAAAQSPSCSSYQLRDSLFSG